MVGRSVSSGYLGADVSALKETLLKLQEELDAEREAAATSASEALSMILRLQGEKAVLAMEASQFKRMTEEKMCYADTSLQLFEDLLYHKEMEIASLEFQVQAYRYRLLSLGCGDIAGVEMKVLENNGIIQQVNGSFFGQTNGNKMRRLQSLPAIQLNGSNEWRRMLEYSENSPSPRGDLNLCLEQIKKLDERMKEISDFRDSLRDKYMMLKQDSVSHTLLPQQGSTGILDSTRSDINIVLERTKDPKTFAKADVFEDYASSSKVQDIYEVPQTKDEKKTCLAEEETKGKFILQGEDRLKKSDLVVEEEKVKPDFKDEEETTKRITKNAKVERKLTEPQRDGSIEKICALAALNAVECQAELQKLKGRIERLEEGRRVSSTRHEIHEEKQDEELDLLKEIKEQLNAVQSEVRSLRTPKKSPFRHDDSPLLALQKVMLYFWL